MRFIDNFKAILLDMCNTFMFDVDRFSDKENYAGTYRLLGGRYLSENRLRAIIDEVYETLERDYLTPAKYEDFPSVMECIERLQCADELPAAEKHMIKQVFAKHEVGEIPPEYVEVISNLARTHKLAVVSNIWSMSRPYLDEMQRSGVHGFFDTIVMSSDHRSIKPSSTLFQKAISDLGVAKSAALFVGDSFDFDIVGAYQVGLSTVWITSGPAPVHNPPPDRMITDLSELLILND